MSRRLPGLAAHSAPPHHHRGRHHRRTRQAWRHRHPSRSLPQHHPAGYRRRRRGTPHRRSHCQPPRHRRPPDATDLRAPFADVSRTGLSCAPVAGCCVACHGLTRLPTEQPEPLSVRCLRSQCTLWPGTDELGPTQSICMHRFALSSVGCGALTQMTGDGWWRRDDDGELLPRTAKPQHAPSSTLRRGARGGGSQRR